MSRRRRVRGPVVGDVLAQPQRAARRDEAAATTRAASPSTRRWSPTARRVEVVVHPARRASSPLRAGRDVSTARGPSVSAATGSSGRSAKPLWRRGSSSAAACSWGRSSEDRTIAAGAVEHGRPRSRWRRGCGARARPAGASARAAARRPRVSNSTSRRSTPARMSSTRRTRIGRAVEVERLAVDEQADDRAVGRRDDRLPGAGEPVGVLGVDDRPGLVEAVEHRRRRRRRACPPRARRARRGSRCRARRPTRAPASWARRPRSARASCRQLPEVVDDDVRRRRRAARRAVDGARRRR